MQSNKVRSEHSAGGVVYRQSEDGTSNTEWLVGKHSGYDKWVLAKGRLEGEETSKEAALREVEEETGVVAKIVGEEPIHIEKYSYKAVPKNAGTSNMEHGTAEPERRVMVYQENEDFDVRDEDVISVDKTVDFYLMEYVEDAAEGHSWEMSEVGWYSYEEAYERLAFEGEKQALKAANELIS